MAKVLINPIIFLFKMCAYKLSLFRHLNNSLYLWNHMEFSFIFASHKIDLGEYMGTYVKYVQSLLKLI